MNQRLGLTTRIAVPYSICLSCNGFDFNICVSRQLGSMLSIVHCRTTAALNYDL
jgi:hypothetical protein